MKKVTKLAAIAFLVIMAHDAKLVLPDIMEIQKFMVIFVNLVNVLVILIPIKLILAILLLENAFIV